jgi:hypothetical protein
MELGKKCSALPIEVISEQNMTGILPMAAIEMFR